MALKPAICTQCGGKIEVDDSKEAGICQFCGTAFVTEKVINKYVTQNITQNTYTGTVYNIQNGPDSDSLYTLARRAKEVGNYNEAYKYYSELRERNPNDWEAVFYHAIYSKESSQVLEFAFKLLEESSLSDEEKFEGKKEFFSELKKNKENSDFIFYLISKTNFSIQEFIAIYGIINDSIGFDIKWADLIEKYYNAALTKNKNVINHECMDLFEFLRRRDWEKAVSILEKMITLPVEDNENENGITAKHRLIESLIILSDVWLPKYPKMKMLEERLAEFEGYIEKSTFCDNKKDLYLFMYKDWIEYLGYCLENNFYNKLVQKIKALEPGFIPKERESTPEKTRKERRQKHREEFLKNTNKIIKQIFGVLFLLAIPFLITHVEWNGYETIWENHPFFSILGYVIYYIVGGSILLSIGSGGNFGKINSFMGNVFFVILESVFPAVLAIYLIESINLSESTSISKIAPVLSILTAVILLAWYIVLIIHWVKSIKRYKENKKYPWEEYK